MLPQARGDVLTGTPAERAAALSALLHRELRAGGLHAPDVSGKYPGFLNSEENRAFLDGCLGFARVTSKRTFARLGAELRAIVLGNREGRR